MTDGMDLQLGAQSEAARQISDSAERIVEIYEDLVDSISTELTVLRGGSAAALGQDFQAWLTSASRLPATLTAYAGSLAAVDRSVANAEIASTGRLQDAYSGGGSALNMGPGPTRE